MKIALYRKIATAIAALASIAAANVIITEIHYNPLPQDTVDGDEFEFIELKNPGSQTAHLDGYAFTNGISYTFPAGDTIGPGSFKVLAYNKLQFKKRYGFEPSGEFSGHLSNSGEKVTLKDTIHQLTIVSVDYKTDAPWPKAADWAGFSLTAVNTNGTGDPDDPSYWRASAKIGGSPGAEDSIIQMDISPVVINEILSNASGDQSNALELYNPGTKDIDISYWYLSNRKSVPAKFKIPAGTVIKASGYIVFDQKELSAPEDSTKRFTFNAHGDGAYIFSADSNGTLSGYCHGFEYGEIDKGISFGRLVNSEDKEQLVAMKSVTLGAKNSAPLCAPLVITEINYYAADGADYIVVTNVTDSTVKLFDPLYPANTWKISGIGFSFPQSVSLKASERVYIVSDTVSASKFRQNHTIESTTKVFSFTGTLSAGGETIVLKKPCEPYASGAFDLLSVPYMDMDAVKFNDKAPWPKCGADSSLIKKNPLSYGNDPESWKSAPGSAGPSSAVIYTGKKAGSAMISNLRFNQNTGILAFSLLHDTQIRVCIVTMQGRVVYNSSFKFRAGENLIATGLNTQAKSVQILKITTNKGLHSFKIASIR